jgi:hypothetical protein
MTRFGLKLRFGTRTLFCMVALLSYLLAFATSIVWPWYREFRSRMSISQFGVQAFTEPRGQFLFRQFAGDELSERVVYLHLDDPRIDDDWLSRLREFEHIEVLSIKSGKVTDQGLMHLRHLMKLRNLNLVDSKVSDSGVRALREALPKLQLVQKPDVNAAAGDEL